MDTANSIFSSFVGVRKKEKEDVCMSLEDGERGGIPPCWLQHRPIRLSAEATDGLGLVLLGNW